MAEEEVGGRGKPICQVCNKAGHVALQCYHRFDFQGKNSQRAASSFPANFSANSQGFPVNSQGSSLSGYSPGSFPGNSHGFSGNSQPSSIPGYFPYNHQRSSQFPQKAVNSQSSSQHNPGTSSTPQALFAAHNTSPEQPSAQDPVWYMDSGATDHVTPDMNQLQSSSNYHGPAQLQVGNGENLSISHTGNTSFPSSLKNRSVHLKNVKCVPQVTRN